MCGITQLLFAWSLLLLPEVSCIADVDDLISPEEIDAFLDRFEDALRIANGAGLHLDRRLNAKAPKGAMPPINYAVMCTSACWTNLSSAFMTQNVILETSTCREEDRAMAKKRRVQKKGEIDAEKKKSGGGKFAGKSGRPPLGGSKGGGEGGKGGKGAKAGTGAQRRLSASKVGKDCILDACEETRMQSMCSNISSIASRMGVSECVQAKMGFICAGICNPQCKGMPDAKKMLCGADGKGLKTKGHAKPGEDMKGGDLKGQLNFMCLKNPSTNAYCMDTIKTEITAKSFSSGESLEAFPNYCDISCSSDASTKVTGLGCCFPALMHVQKNYKALNKGAFRTVMATAKKCGSATVFTPCASGSLVTARNKQFDLTMPTGYGCAAIQSEDAQDAFVASMAEYINGSVGSIEVTNCNPPCSGSGRRLSSESAGINAETSGPNAAADMTALEAALSDSALVSQMMSDSLDAAALEESTESSKKKNDNAALVSAAIVSSTFSGVWLILASSSWRIMLLIL